MKSNHILLTCLALLTSLIFQQSLVHAFAKEFNGIDIDSTPPFRGTTRRGITGPFGGAGKGGKGGKGDDGVVLPDLPGGSGGIISGGGGRTIGGVPDELPRPKTNAEMGLSRYPLPIPAGFDAPFMKVILERPNQNFNWARYENRGQNKDEKEGVDVVVCDYLTSPADNAYVVKNVNTEHSAGDIKVRDITADNYVSSGGDLSTLRYVGTENIIEQRTKDAIVNAYSARGKDVDEDFEVMTFRPDQAEWAKLTKDNPFLGDQLQLLRERAPELNNARIDEVRVMTRDGDIGGTEIFMVTILTRDPLVL